MSHIGHLKLPQNQWCRKTGLDFSRFVYLLVCLGILLAVGTFEEEGVKDIRIQQKPYPLAPIPNLQINFRSLQNAFAPH
jgi:hypothetical protein